MQVYHNETIYDPMFPRPLARPITSQELKSQIEDKNSEWAIESRSILRAILRECTYLPDPQARRYVHQRALAGFRRWVHKAQRLRETDVFEARLLDKRKEARSTVKDLNRANQGEAKMLRKVLLATYGRSGRRRWELLSPLIRSSGQQHAFLQNLPNLMSGDKEQDSVEATAIKEPHATTSDQSLPSATSSRPKTDKSVSSRTVKESQTRRATRNTPEVPRDRLQIPHAFVGEIAEIYLPTQLRELVRSQLIHDLVPVHQREALLLRPSIRALNNHGLPMPMSRVRNMINDWYNNVLSSVLPPLPHDEWNRLRDLANTMRHPHEVLIPRRCGPAADARPMSMLELVVSGTHFHEGHFENRSARNLTPRAMLRMWAEIFRLCPVMSKKEEDKYWNVTWGHQALGTPRRAGQPESSLDGRSESPA
jgi:hypothetical protein